MNKRMQTNSSLFSCTCSGLHLLFEQASFSRLNRSPDKDYLHLRATMSTKFVNWLKHSWDLHSYKIDLETNVNASTI